MIDSSSRASDEDIARAVQRGDREQFGFLVERFEQKMTRYVRRFLYGYDDAADVVQETFLKAYVNIQSFDPDRKFSSWLYRIAHNESVNVLKKRKREAIPFFDPDTIFPQPASKETAEDAAERRQLREQLDRSLVKLDAKYREALVLYYFEELSYQEIADILQIPVPTVGVRLRRGRKALEQAYAAGNIPAQRQTA